MQSRRDQVQAQSYVWSRLVTALVVADPDGAENPHRSIVVGTLSGLLVAAIIAVGFTVYGFIKPGGARAWQAPGVLVVEKETGSRYVYVDRKLRPVLNYASALLLFPQPPTVVSVSRQSLAGVPHGQPLGVPGAGSESGAPGRVAAQAWTVCAFSARSDVGQTVTATTLAITDGATAGDRPLVANQAILVTAGAGRDYLVWRGRRMKLTEDWLVKLLGADRTKVPVLENWLDAVPAGPDLAPPAVPARGQPGPVVEGRPATIGELFVVRPAGGTERYYQLRPDGLRALSAMEYAMTAADPETAKLYGGGLVRPKELSLAALTRLPLAPAGPVNVLPESLPELRSAPPGRSWCVRQSMANGATEIVAGTAVPATGLVTDGVGLRRTGDTARAVAVRGGVGGLVAAGRFGQPPGPNRYLVTDAGIKYPVANDDAAARLGYPPGGARPVPPELLDLLPSGPALGGAAG